MISPWRLGTRHHTTGSPLLHFLLLSNSSLIGFLFGSGMGKTRRFGVDESSSAFDVVRGVIGWKWNALSWVIG